MCVIEGVTIVVRRIIILVLSTQIIFNGNFVVHYYDWFSFLSGDWAGQLEHICAHLSHKCKMDIAFRTSFGKPKLGQVGGFTWCQLIFLMNKIIFIVVRKIHFLCIN